jgi:hypothetical protein
MLASVTSRPNFRAERTAPSRSRLCSERTYPKKQPCRCTSVTSRFDFRVIRAAPVRKRSQGMTLAPVLPLPHGRGSVFVRCNGAIVRDFGPAPRVACPPVRAAPPTSGKGRRFRSMSAPLRSRLCFPCQVSERNTLANPQNHVCSCTRPLVNSRTCVEQRTVNSRAAVRVTASRIHAP